jgi:thiamine-monophosphate kinase
MSEFNWIAKYFAPLATRTGAAGLIDDVAEFSGKASIVTVDALVEGVHFLPDDPMDTVARKLVRVNVSDLIAKGARPDEALLTLGWPRGRDEAELADFAKAFGEELTAWGVSLIGGDTVASPDGVFLSLTMTGVPATTRAPIRRSGAQVGDWIWLTGEVIGASYLGLRDRLAGTRSDASRIYQLPVIPKLDMADVIAACATASMDVSDGLLGDLQKLLAASECGATLALEDISIHRPDWREEKTLSEVLDACTGGDDYQCLFTAPPSKTREIEAARQFPKIIGRIEKEAGLRLTWYDEAVPLPEKTGFEHA